MGHEGVIEHFLFGEVYGIKTPFITGFAKVDDGDDPCFLKGVLSPEIKISDEGVAEAIEIQPAFFKLNRFIEGLDVLLEVHGRLFSACL